MGYVTVRPVVAMAVFSIIFMIRPAAAVHGIIVTVKRVHRVFMICIVLIGGNFGIMPVYQLFIHFDQAIQILQQLYQGITDAQNAKADYVGEDNYVYRWNAVAGEYQRTALYVKGDPGTTDYNQLENKPDLKPVATTGNYGDLTNKPDLSNDVEFVESEPGTWPF